MADSELHNLLPFAEILDNIDVGIALFDPRKLPVCQYKPDQLEKYSLRGISQPQCP